MFFFFNFAFHNYSKRTINRKLSYYTNSLCYCKYSIMHDGTTYIVHAFSTSTIGNRGMFYNSAILCEILNESNFCLTSFRMARMLLLGIVDVCGSWSFRRRAVQAGAHHPVLLTTTAKY